MATSRIIEEERGTSRGFYHHHNGYYAGDFAGADATTLHRSGWQMPTSQIRGTQ
jgi:hypothetical protein